VPPNVFFSGSLSRINMMRLRNFVINLKLYKVVKNNIQYSKFIFKGFFFVIEALLRDLLDIKREP
jgi:hypothetical protein